MSTRYIDGMESSRRKRGAEDDGEEEKAGRDWEGGGLRKRGLFVAEDADAMET